MTNSTFWKKFTFWEKYDGLFIYWMANWEKKLGKIYYTMGNSSLSSLKMRNSKVHALLYGYIARNGMTHTLVCGTFGARSFRVVQLRDFHRLWCVFFVIVGNSSSRVSAWDLERVCKRLGDFHCGKRRRFVFWHCSTTDLNFRVSSPFPLPASRFPFRGGHFCPRLPLFSNVSSLCLLRKSDHALT